MGCETKEDLNFDSGEKFSKNLETKLIPDILVQNIYQECDAV
jgi:hypothetical protein